MDAESSAWLTALRGTGATREAGLGRLHDLLLRVAIREAHRRSANTSIRGPELDDIAHQAASDAMVSILAKLDTFRGESRFTTWAYRFAVLEVSSKFGRHYWRRPSTPLEIEDWERLPDRFGLDPQRRAEQRELIDAVHRAVDETLTEHQRGLFVAIVVNAVPLDAMVARSGSSRNAIYKAIFDARRKIRAFLVTNGYLDLDHGGPPRPQQAGQQVGPVTTRWATLERFLATDPRDVGCEEAMRILHVYVELIASDRDAAARYPGVAAHLAACGPCSEDFHGLLAAVIDPEPPGRPDQP